MGTPKTLPRDEAYALRIARYMMARGSKAEHALETAAMWLMAGRASSDGAAALQATAERCTSPDPCHALWAASYE